MFEDLKVLMGYDDRGIVYDVDAYILRRVLPEWWDGAHNIYSLYKKFNLDKHGIVQTALDLSYGENFLKHKKHLITYPHEWTASMFKDAVLFHLNLFLNLDKFDLRLKDAHPHNILFDSNEFVFVDFLSILPKKSLEQEKSLLDFVGPDNYSKYKDPSFIVFDAMFFPELLIPLIIMGRKEYSEARNILCNRGCNCSSNIPGWQDLHDIKRDGRFVVNFIENLRLKWFLKSKRKLNFIDFCKALVELVNTLDVIPPKTTYDTYYEDKNENFSYENTSKWGNKQNSVYNVLQEVKPNKVLDLGANTGWFSILAAKLGAQVIATDIEESAVDLLYRFSQKNSLNIIPLLLPFENLVKDVYGSYDSRLDFKKPKSNPIFMAGIKRLQSDVVLCLALMHHLVLGMGIDLYRFMEILAKLTNKALVVEYVDLDDHLIRLNPSSFTKNRDTYSLENVISASKKQFKDVQIFDSTPKTRKILVFKK